MNEHLTNFQTKSPEGYVYASYGSAGYLKNVISSVITLRRYDTKRPVILYCSKEHQKLLDKYSLEYLFKSVEVLSAEHASIPGFKHNIHMFMPFEKNLILDSDIVWCRDPNTLWQSLSPYKFTITGNEKADVFFGGPKGFSVLIDILMRRRERTLKRFGLSYLSRVQAGMIYAADKDETSKICELSKLFFKRQDETHFRSRREEKGREEESCEWSLAMAMASSKIQVYPWLNGYESPQLDFIESFTQYSTGFEDVKCLYYSDQFVYDLKGLKNRTIQKILIRILSMLPGKGDHLYVTPYCLHFGWMHQKEALKSFSESCWRELTEK
ncbi:MAG: hypothetical protein JJU37_05335 [Balneolaceae bacterium]|nr:hypothetical protein [Balneolaceae bacterium]